MSHPAPDSCRDWRCSHWWLMPKTLEPARAHQPAGSWLRQDGHARVDASDPSLGPGPGGDTQGVDDAFSGQSREAHSAGGGDWSGSLTIPAADTTHPATAR